MKLIIDKNQLSHNYLYWLTRIAGYQQLPKHNGEDNFARVLQTGGYPRFHVYLEETNEAVILNLHVDQKRPSYAGSSAHNGEYDSPLVVQEIARLKSLIQ